jgi:hypothetical protein
VRCLPSEDLRLLSLEVRLSDFSAEAAESSDILRSSRSFLRCSRTVSTPCSSHLTEVPDAAKMTDEPVERRELDGATDTGRSDEDVTEAGRPELTFSTESRLD